MHLIIERDQDKGFLGGIKFVLKGKVLLTPDEESLVRKYKAHKYSLFSNETQHITVQDLSIGLKKKTDDIGLLIELERGMIKACDTLKGLLDIMSSFGGQMKLEFRSDGIYDELGNLYE